MSFFQKSPSTWRSLQEGSWNIKQTESSKQKFTFKQIPLLNNDRYNNDKKSQKKLIIQTEPYQEPPKSQFQIQSTTNQTFKKIQIQSNSCKHDQNKSFNFQSNINVRSSLPDKESINLKQMPNQEPTKCSFRKNGIIKAYGANTNQGIVRNYNEDRVSIILNIMKPNSRQNEDWPKCSFFGVYDGHGGVNCADFLRDNLHQYVIKESCFPNDPLNAIRKGFAKAEKIFLEKADNGDKLERSGSCALVVLLIGDMCYVANVGDSRGIISCDEGKIVKAISQDHKPSDEKEFKRITKAGGKIYQSQTQSKQNGDVVVGPVRVFPGRLSVSRTFGDIEAKLVKYGGNPEVVIAEPEIFQFELNDNLDFMILASDGIFDKLENEDIVQCAWESTKNLSENVHQQCGKCVESIMQNSLNAKTLDNITVVMICFSNFFDVLFGKKEDNQTKTYLKENNSNLRKSNLTSSSLNLGQSINQFKIKQNNTFYQQFLEKNIFKERNMNIQSARVLLKEKQDSSNTNYQKNSFLYNQQ